MRSPNALPSALLLASPRADATVELRRRLAEQPQQVAREWSAKGLATYGLARLPELAADSTPVRPVLEQAALLELGWTAKRRLALTELNNMAADGLPRLLFKGAATSIAFYPQETWRWSGDIDVMMHEQDLEELHPMAMAELRAKLLEIPFPEHHIERQIVAGTAIELHYRLEFAPIWGTLPDLLPDASPCPGFPRLLVPGSHTSFTLALLHLLKHRLGMPFDILDLARIETAGLDWGRLADQWRAAGIVAHTAAALGAAHEIAGIAPTDTVRQLQRSLGGTDSRRAQFLQRCILAPGLSQLREYRFECLVNGISFPGFCLRMLLGTRAVTQRLTGRRPHDPRFWFSHLVSLPCRRVCRLATQLRRPGSARHNSPGN